jgi:hypothetical protein
MADALSNPFLGRWTYRSFLNDPDPKADPTKKLLFGIGTLKFTEAPMGQVAGVIGGKGWSLKLEGWVTYGDPYRVRFQGKGIVSKAPWIYDYDGFYVSHWPNGVGQVEAIVGSVIRTIPHPDNGGIGKAGLVASFYAVRQS